MSNSATSNNAAAPVLALTPGEPAGIGPDIALQLATRQWPQRVVFIADPALLAARAHALGLAVTIREVPTTAASDRHVAGVLQVLPVALASAVRPGRLDPANAGYVLHCLDAAIDACRDGTADAMVTGPVNKAVINDAGITFSGHTEYLAARLGADLPVMLLAAGDLRVALMTTHCPLAAVPALITAALIRQVVHIVAADLARVFGVRQPRITICGLNPHAGEQGHLGVEEVQVITPAVAALRAEGIDIRGPLPADTAFTGAERQRSDVIIAMYHDQGLTALKALSFGDAVNVTLGLPILRTSVDHGTALDLAGRGGADAASLCAALALAGELAGARRCAA